MNTTTKLPATTKLAEVRTTTILPVVINASNKSTSTTKAQRSQTTSKYTPARRSAETPSQQGDVDWVGLSGILFDIGGRPVGDMGLADGWKATGEEYELPGLIEANGFCLLKGEIEAVVKTGQIAPELPVKVANLAANMTNGCRPRQRSIFNVALLGFKTARIDVDRDGSIIWYAGGDPKQDKLSFSGIIFGESESICRSPQVAGAPDAGSCKQGGHIASNSSCMAQCRYGYTPSKKVLKCKNGLLSPETFECVPNSCTPPVVPNQGIASCNQSGKIKSGEKCFTSCAHGLTPSVSTLSCLAGELSPPTFSCLVCY
eukprot:TRINITY_DN18697_c0_g1_i1.p1 TRINITY_DN18697_c0_g1~~TRINITY_DN18697_c0_g1_i1.p1  ORF type:complete len:316 (-),score=44.24 TRINITY_DN18697_c0_g1_i1:27-974(-)